MVRKCRIYLTRWFPSEFSLWGTLASARTYMREHTFSTTIVKVQVHAHTHEYFARIVRRAMRVLRRSRSRRLFTRSMVPPRPPRVRACVCVYACMRVCTTPKSELGAIERKRDEGRNNNSAAFSGNDPSPSLQPSSPMPCSKPTGDIPHWSLSLSHPPLPLQLLLSPRPPMFATYSFLRIFFPSFSSFTCRDGNPRSRREKRGYQTNR